MNLHIWRCTIYILYLEMQVEKDWSEFFFFFGEISIYGDGDAKCSTVGVTQ